MMVLSRKLAAAIVAIGIGASVSNPARADSDEQILSLANCGNWPLTKGASLSLRVMPTNGPYGTARLVIAKDDKILRDLSFPNLPAIDTEFMSVSCDGKAIKIWHAVHATSHYALYAWNGQTTLTRLRQYAENENAKALHRIEDKIAKGERYSDDDLGMAIYYPGDIDWPGTITDVIRDAGRLGRKLADQGRYADAAARMKAMFDLTMEFTYQAGVSAFDSVGSTPDSTDWWDAWRLGQVKIGAFIAELNDYGFYLQQDGQHDKAIAIFRAVLEWDPDRIVASLNLADSLWATGQKDEARQTYAIYAIRMKAAGKAMLIPQPVAQRSGG